MSDLPEINTRQFAALEILANASQPCMAWEIRDGLRDTDLGTTGELGLKSAGSTLKSLLRRGLADRFSEMVPPLEFPVVTWEITPEGEEEVGIVASYEKRTIPRRLREQAHSLIELDMPLFLTGQFTADEARYINTYIRDQGHDVVMVSMEMLPDVEGRTPLEYVADKFGPLTPAAP